MEDYSRKDRSGWSKADCAAIGWALGGGFVVMAILEVVFGC